jgi:hypothetical protein
MFERDKFNYTNIPDFLKKLKVWNIADYRKQKAPEDINGKYRGYNKKYQVAYEVALKNAKTYKKMLSIGINLENRFTWIDLDNCFDENGNLKEWAKPIVTLAIYCEISYSGKGLHVCIKGIHFDKNIIIKMNKIYKNECDKSAIEIYINGKNLALTGRTYSYKNDKYDIKMVKNQIAEYQNIIQKTKEEKYKNNSNHKNNKKYNFDNNVFLEIKDKIDIKQVLENYGVKFNHLNKAICPFHREKTPSLYINKDNTYHCFGCGAHGDAIQFIKDKFLLSTIDSIKKLNSEFNLNIDIKFKPVIKETVDKVVDKSSINYITEYNNFKGKLTFKEDISFVDDNKYYINKDLGTGYYLTNKGFIERYTDKDEEKYFDKIITPVQLIPEYLIYIDRKEELLLKALNGLNEEKNIFKPVKAFSSPQQFRQFLNEIFKVNNWFDGGTKDLIAYDKYISGILKYMKLSRQDASNKLGWYKNEFLPYSNKILLLNNDWNELNTIESIHKQGSFKLWQEYIGECLENDTFRMYLNVSLASVLIDFLNLQGFGFYNYAPPSRGKSIASYAAWSIWGKPCKLTIPAFNANRAGLEARLAILNNFPAIFDDAQHLDASIKKNIEKIIYDIANGSGKTRMTKDITARNVNTWASTFIITGERELLDQTNDSGAYKRCIELSDIPMSGRHFPRKVKNVVMDNYGFIGPLFIKFIQNSGKKFLLEELNNIEEKLINDQNIEDHITHLSVLTMCDKFLMRTLNLDYNSLNWGKRILKRLPTKQSIDKMEYGKEMIKEIYLKNQHRFDIDNKISWPRLGFRDNGAICFFRNELTKILKEYDIPEKQFIKYLKINNFVNLDKNGNFGVVRFNGRLCRPIKFKETFFIENEEKYEQQKLDSKNLK